jgi:hypothetical protein
VRIVDGGSGYRGGRVVAADRVVHDYIGLLRALDRLLPGVLDEPGAPPPGPALAPPALVRAAGRLAAALPGDLGPARREFLRDQLTAVEWTARRLAGQGVAFPDEVRTAYGVRPGLGDPDDYRRAHAALDGLLPGRGDLAARRRAHRDADAVPRERLADALARVAGALRERVRAAVPLPADEAVAFRVVDDAPWAALHRYLGRHRSAVTVNAGARPRWGGLVPLLAHEAYPGHHAERCRAAVAGLPEQQVVLATSPQSLVAEGAAELGLAAVVGGGWAELARGLPFDADLAERLHAASAPLARVRLDAALLLRARGADAARAHLRRWLLLDDRAADRVLRFLRHPVWRAHPVTYVEGRALAHRWWALDPSPARYLRLLDEPWTPGRLAAEAPLNGSSGATDGRR